jgi:hypothetical protein
MLRAESDAITCKDGRPSVVSGSKRSYCSNPAYDDDDQSHLGSVGVIMSRWTIPVLDYTQQSTMADPEDDYLAYLSSQALTSPSGIPPGIRTQNLLIRIPNDQEVERQITFY